MQHVELYSDGSSRGNPGPGGFGTILRYTDPAGNVHERSIQEIYRDSPALQHCADLDVDHIEKCSDCAIRYICGGACRARGYYETGRIDGTGDFCDYELNAFLDGIVKIYSANLLQ